MKHTKFKTSFKYLPNIEIKISGIYKYGVQAELKRSNGTYSQFSLTEINSYKVSINTKLTNTK